MGERVAHQVARGKNGGCGACALSVVLESEYSNENTRDIFN